MDLFKGIAIFVGWLTSSLAGIVAIFYACGYLVARAQLNMLGLSGLFEYPKEHYIQEGGKFFVSVTGMIIGKLLPRLVLVLYALAFASVVALLAFAVCLHFRNRPSLEVCERLKSCLPTELKGPSRLWALILLLCLAFVLVFFALDYLNSFAAVLGVSNLLYASAQTTSGSDDASLVARWLLEGDSQRLQLLFLRLIRGELLAVLLLTAAWHVAAVFQSARLWLLSPFIIVSILYTIFTPMAYGVLVRPAKYAVVSFTWKDESIAAAPSGFYLLNKSDRELVLWDRDHRKVLCVSRDLVLGAQVSELRPLFHHTDHDE